MSYRLPGLYRTKFMWICLRHCRCPMCRSLSLLALRVSWQTGLPLFFYSSLDEDWSVWNTAAAFLKKKRFLFICIQKGPEMESRSFKVACSKTHRPSVRQWKMKNTCSDTNYWQKWVNQVTQQHWQQGLYIKSETLLWHLNTGLKCWINRKDLSDRVVNNKTYIIKKTERNK